MPISHKQCQLQSLLHEYDLSNSAVSSDLEHRFQGHDILQCQITRKLYKIEL